MTAVNGVLGSPRWTAIYRCVKHPRQPEVIMNSLERPDEERTFRVPGVGNTLFRLVSLTPLNEPEGGFNRMAKQKRKRKARSKKKKEETEELEGLEGLDDDLEELDEEEPDEVEDEDSEDDEDLEDDDDEEEEEEKPKKRKRKKGKGKKGKTPPTRELPKGKYGAAEIAELAGVDARAVRLFLRKKANKKKFPKDAELGRYSFTKKDAVRIAKAIKKGSKEEEDEDDE